MEKKTHQIFLKIWRFLFLKSLDFSVLDFTSECFIYREPLLTMIKEKVLYYISAMMIS